ncbi:glycosyltransferase [Limosilactobacillus reuteri]|uniref:glycosyltransferase family 2 protein n=1 Tax=Limosilactobacillus reuteri TaxID=1598 RepID=UPI001E474CBC|nr:glycosyltransferase family 2 protein [Limosilactobacillus reuteri]MCC4404972.1 glycosyltransferase [Limosilactobacillus reuteri]
MKKSATITIIVSVYNVEKFLFDCLNSLKNQTYRNFEVLLIDDGSTDNSKDICKQFCDDDSRFKYFFKENGGLSDARNYGLKWVSGDYVIFVDGDDYVASQYVEKLYSTVIKNHAEVAICGFQAVNSQHKKIYEVKLNTLHAGKTYSGRQIIKSYFVKEGGWGISTAWNKIYNARLFNNFQFTKGKYYEDELLFWQMFPKLERVVVINEPLYYYVQRSGSIMNSAISMKKIKDGNYLCLEKMSLLKNMPDIYNLTVLNYEKWIIDNWSNYRQFLVKHGLHKYMQKQFRFCVKQVASANFKTKMRNCLAYLNLDTVFIIKKYCRIFK